MIHHRKLDPCAIRCVFLGFAPQQKRYKCYLFETRHMHVTMDVAFSESEYFYASIPSPFDHQGKILVSHPDPGSTTSQARSTTVARYCSLWAPDYALTILFLGTHTRTSQWVTHHGSALARYSLNFGVPMEPEASELPKGLVLGRDENLHIRITPLGDVGSHNPLPLGARRPRRHTSCQGLAMIPNCHILTWGPPHPEPAPLP